MRSTILLIALAACLLLAFSTSPVAASEARLLDVDFQQAIAALRASVQAASPDELRVSFDDFNQQNDLETEAASTQLLEMANEPVLMDNVGSDETNMDLFLALQSIAAEAAAAGGEQTPAGSDPQLQVLLRWFMRELATRSGAPDSQISTMVNSAFKMQYPTGFQVPNTGDLNVVLQDVQLPEAIVYSEPVCSGFQVVDNGAGVLTLTIQNFAVTINSVKVQLKLHHAGPIQLLGTKFVTIKNARLTGSLRLDVGAAKWPQISTTYRLLNTQFTADKVALEGRTWLGTIALKLVSKLAGLLNHDFTATFIQVVKQALAMPIPTFVFNTPL
jgi:hypothetical protein